MRAKIAVVGAGVIGMMTALACARLGLHVDLFEKNDVPNTSGTSFDYARLFRAVHESNEQLENLAFASQPYWLEMSAKFGDTLVKPSMTVRALDSQACEVLQQHYLQRSVSFTVCDQAQRNALGQLYRFPDRGAIFLGHDALILNSREILANLHREILQAQNIRLMPRTLVECITLEPKCSLMHDGKNANYDGVIFTIAAPLAHFPLDAPDEQPVRKFQYYLNLHLAPEQRSPAFLPILNFADAHRSWSVPSNDHSVIKISASECAFEALPDAAQLNGMRDRLLANARFEFQSVESKIVPYFEHTAKKRRSTPYWRRLPQTNAILVDACDAGLFKAAPAIATQLATSLLELL